MRITNGDRGAQAFGRCRRGSALLAVLWMAAALAAIAFALSTTVRTETGRAGNAADGLRAYYLASGSVERGIQWMLWGSTGYTPMNRDGTPRFWIPNTPRLNMQYPSGDAVVELIPESAKLDINTANLDELTRVITAVSADPGVARAIAEGIIDWRTPGPGGPGGFDLSLSSTFQPRHASFQEIEELLLVRGVTPELFYGNFVSDSEGRLYARGGLRDCLSVWGSHGPYDINTASPAVMEAAGVPAGAIQQILQRRTAKPFHDMGEVNALGISAPGLAVGGRHVWTLRATARLRHPDGSPSEVLRTSAATVELLDPRAYPVMPIAVLRYYDDAWSELSVAPPGPASAANPAVPGAALGAVAP